MSIDFTLSETQQVLKNSARDFAERFLTPIRDKFDQISDPWEAFLASREAYREMAHAGFTKSFIPLEYGGLGFSMVDLALASEELCRVEISVPSTLLCTGLGLQPIIQYGTHEQKEKFLRDFANDTEGDLLAAFAFTDVAGGANYDSNEPPAGIQTIARLEGDHWVINGQKHYTSNGTGWDKKGAHLFTVVCRTDRNRGADDSLAVIAVPGNTPGIEITDIYSKLGHRGMVHPSINFTNVRVPVDNLIGKPGKEGKAIVEGAFTFTASQIGAAAVGVMRAAFEEAFNFAHRENRLGATTVIHHQSVGFKLVNMRMQIEAAKSLTWKACDTLDKTNWKNQEQAIMAKVYCGELAVQLVYEAMRVVGVESYFTLSPLQRLMRDALVFPIYDGSNDGVRRRQLHSILMNPAYDLTQV